MHLEPTMANLERIRSVLLLLEFESLESKPFGGEAILLPMIGVKESSRPRKAPLRVSPRQLLPLDGSLQSEPQSYFMGLAPSPDDTSRCDSVYQAMRKPMSVSPTGESLTPSRKFGLHLLAGFGHKVFHAKL